VLISPGKSLSFCHTFLGKGRVESGDIIKSGQAKVGGIAEFLGIDVVVGGCKGLSGWVVSRKTMLNTSRSVPVICLGSGGSGEGEFHILSEENVEFPISTIPQLILRSCFTSILPDRHFTQLRHTGKRVPTGTGRVPKILLPMGLAKTYDP
jgi:hypothetical protein